MKNQDPILPLSTDKLINGPTLSASPALMSASPGPIFANGSAVSGKEEKNNASRPGRPRGVTNGAWLPPEIKQEGTWRTGDMNRVQGLGETVTRARIRLIYF